MAKKLFITEKDWNAICALIDTLSSDQCPLGIARNADWRQFEKRTVSKINKQLNYKKVSKK